jgi:hypothetical protein
MWCFAKFNISDADDMEAVFGLLPPAAEAAADTTAELLALDDGIYFEKAETATEFDAHTRKNDTSTEATLCTATFADGTDRILGFSVDVAGNVHFWDGTTIDNLVEVATVNVTGAALAKDITVDWFFVVQER